MLAKTDEENYPDEFCSYMAEGDNMKKNTAVRLLLLVVLVILIAAVIIMVIARIDQEEAKAPVEVSVSVDDDTSAFSQVQNYIDEGDCLGVAEVLLTGEFSETLYASLMAEDAKVMEAIMEDAMLWYAEQGELEKLVALRINGYVSDACFLRYWERMGCEKPEETEAPVGVDAYLIHELHLAYLRNENAITDLREMRTTGVLNGEMHTALVETLGFDYTDDSYLDKNGIAPLRSLTDAEMAAYEKVLELIDQGEGQQVFQMFRYGEVNQAVYDALVAEDGEIIDYIVAEGLVGLAADGKSKDMVTLRVNGYVSDTCFEYYWEMSGSDVFPERSEEDVPGVDWYLLYELEQIYGREENGGEVLGEIWYSGLLSDETHEELINRLGFDYMQNE